MSLTTAPEELGLQHAPESTAQHNTEIISSCSDTQNYRDQQHTTSLTDQTNLLPFKKIIVCFLGLALCIVVSTLDSVIVATAIPTISAAFDAGSIVSWVPSAYLLTSTSFQPLYGRLSDIFGRKAAISVAMLVFMLGNLLAGFSRTIIQLIVFRGIAGAGGGGIISMAQIVISDIVSLRDRGKYQGIIGVVIALGYAVGPLIGGSLAQNVSWRWCFWICIPVSGCAMAVVIFILPLKPVKGNMTGKLLSVDFFGAVLTLVGCTLVILPLIWGGVTFPWGSAVVLAPLLSGCLVVVLFCIWEWKGARLPIVPMYIFKHATVTGVYITMFVNGFVFFSSLYYLPQYFQVVLGYDPVGAGVFLIPVLVSQMVLSWIAGVIVSRTGRYRSIIHSGFAIWSISCGLTSTLTPHSHKAEIVIFMLLAGSGAGQTLQTTTVAAQASVSRRDMSVVTAFRNFIRLLGGTLALALGSTILNNSLRSAMSSLEYPSVLTSRIVDNPALLSTPTALDISASDASFILNAGYTKGFRTVFILNAALTAVATIASITLIKHKDLNRGDENNLKAATSEVNKGEDEMKMYPKVTSNLAKVGMAGDKEV
ncbi:Efflux pump dotC [Psilocybe cubensis]|uniref:Major facilitator superfamily (MFS) profile domain-containing protein n=2 Tax=Psilocybe cubensis TaxID=181762 RepID=A0A8H7Y9E1_PSICU|nr:Efflux pump dotC [Psilocybe cubensis]KAH9485880.1 Efflux pump dotC [Psilocybe cubensis]